MEETRFGDLLRRLRLAVDLSQEELADRAGLSVQAISALERGIRRAPYRHTLDALATALDLDQEGRTLLLAAAQRRRPARAEGDADDEVGPRLAIAAPPRPPQPPRPPSPPPPPEAGLIGRGWPSRRCCRTPAGARLLTLTGPGGASPR